MYKSSIFFPSSQPYFLLNLTGDSLTVNEVALFGFFGYSSPELNNVLISEINSGGQTVNVTSGGELHFTEIGFSADAGTVGIIGIIYKRHTGLDFHSAALVGCSR